MGYWDKKEPQKRVEATEEAPVAQDTEHIDFDALDQYEADANARAKDILEAVDDLAAQVKRQKAHMGDITNTNYWFAVCFNNQAQKEEYLEKIGMKKTDTFLSGKQFAMKTGVDIKSPSKVYNKKGVVPKFKQRAREIEE